MANSTDRDGDTPVMLLLDPLNAILKVDPNSDPADQAELIDEDATPA
jgi:hypothetical protein